MNNETDKEIAERVIHTQCPTNNVEWTAFCKVVHECARRLLARVEAREAAKIKTFGHVSYVNPDDQNSQPELPSYENIADMLPSILANASTKCPLCGQQGVHNHTPQEIVIYRNGVKYGRALNPSPVSAAVAAERGFTEVDADELKKAGYDPQVIWFSDKGGQWQCWLYPHGLNFSTHFKGKTMRHVVDQALEFVRARSNSAGGGK